MQTRDDVMGGEENRGSNVWLKWAISLMAGASLFVFPQRCSEACPLCEAAGSSFADDLQSPAIGIMGEIEWSLPNKEGGGFETKVVVETILGRPFAKPKVPRLWTLESFDRNAKVLLIGVPDCIQNPAEQSIQSLSGPDLEKSQVPMKEEWIWSPPIKLTESAVGYIRALPSQESPEVDRLRFYYKHLFSSETIVSNDAYTECPRASLESMRHPRFQQAIDWSQLVHAIESPNFDARKKSFLWMVLATSERFEGIELYRRLVRPMLEPELSSNTRERTDPNFIQSYPWLAASIACYINRAGDSAISEIEQKILSNTKCTICLKSAAISAIRVLATDLHAYSFKRMGQSLALVLADPDCVDLVIPDLMRWEYWDATEQLAQLFHTEEADSQFSRVPIINFMRRCPLEVARNHLTEMKRTDPKAYRRAVTLIPILEPAPFR